MGDYTAVTEAMNIGAEQTALLREVVAGKKKHPPMTDLRTRLALAIKDATFLRSWEISLATDAVLAVLASPTDADVERVARGIDKQDFFTPWSSSKRALAAIRALVGGDAS